jgi:hypothetical protein
LSVRIYVSDFIPAPLIGHEAGRLAFGEGGPVVHPTAEEINNALRRDGPWYERVDWSQIVDGNNLVAWMVRCPECPHYWCGGRACPLHEAIADSVFKREREEREAMMKAIKKAHP